MCSFACAHFLLLIQNGQKQTDPGSLEDLSRDETDRAVPLSEPITIQRRSPLIRNHKTGSMEVRCLFIVITLVSSGICWKTHLFTGFGFSNIRGGRAHEILSSVLCSRFSVRCVLTLRKINCPVHGNSQHRTSLPNPNKHVGKKRYQASIRDDKWAWKLRRTFWFMI